MPDPAKPAPATFDVSPDGRKITIHQPTTPGRKVVSTNTWGFDPSPDLIYKAIHHVEVLSANMVPTEKIRARRLGPVIIYSDTGPPIWYWPHVRVKLGHDWLISIGWIKAAITCMRTHAPQR